MLPGLWTLNAHIVLRDEGDIIRKALLYIIVLYILVRSSSVVVPVQTQYRASLIPTPLGHVLYFFMTSASPVFFIT